MEDTMQAENDRPAPATRVRLKPDERRRLILEAAFRAVADEGFEGLRTRDIAAAIGINSATLHHYFPTKDDLIAAIADHLEHRLRTEHAPVQDDADVDPFGRQFDDLAWYHAEAPELLAVFREFVARAPRDLMIRALVDRLHAGWHASIVTALERARAQGLLRADVDPDACARIVLGTAWSLVARICVSMEELDAAAGQLRTLVRAPDRSRP
jgi:AcrR family transcriptional regulator